MGRILAIDFGLKRCGLAETDDLQIIASALKTVDSEQLIPTLENYIREHEVEGIVIGQAIRMGGEMSAIETNILELVKELEKRFSGIRIYRQDERFTSKLALDAMIVGGVKKKDRRNKQKGIVDKVSAVLILQAFLERKSI